jgi:hypothetical protein
VSTSVQVPSTLRLEEFWSWLKEHCNCILRAGSADVELHDGDDLHWHLEGDAREPVVQLIQGKRLLAALFMEVHDIAFVQAVASDEPEDRSTLFELVSTGKEGNFSPYHFLMAHPLETEVPNHGHGLKH